MNQLVTCCDNYSLHVPHHSILVSVPILQDHIAAVKEIMECKTLQELLSATLALGNFVNHGGRHGNAPGFRLKALNKLHDTKSLDNKCTMLQALARQLHQRKLKEGKEIKLLSEEVPHVMSNSMKISWQDAADMLTQVMNVLHLSKDRPCFKL